jgi:hypothetical protein
MYKLIINVGLNVWHFEQLEATCVALIKQVSSVQSECRLTMGNDRLKYYHMFFGVPKNSPYQQELRKEYWSINNECISNIYL